MYSKSTVQKVQKCNQNNQTLSIAKDETGKERVWVSSEPMVASNNGTQNFWLKNSDLTIIISIN